MSSPLPSRRAFLKSASLASAAVAFPHVMRSQQGRSPNDRLNIACIGVGGRGAAAVNGVKGENLVAFCDVDDARAAATFKKFPEVPRFRDFRKLLEKLGNRIDAVTVSTPDHMHYPIAMAAMSLGKHVFVEKPMSHTIAEARTMARVAREKKLATQMGNQGHASDGMRMLKEWFDAGILGEVREIHTWTDRPIWPQGVKGHDHSKLMPVVPPTLDWDLWLGVAAEREYDPAYLPFNWRGYWDFGTGALGDMGCHMLDGGFWAFDLTAPTVIEAVSSKQTAISAPTASVVTYHFPARGRHPALKWYWYDGSLEPTLPPQFEGQKIPENGTFIIGSKATVSAHPNYFTVRIMPEAKMQELAPSLPPKTLPRIPGGDHFMEWVNACKGGTPAGANFEYSSRLTEMVLLSNVAVRARHRLEWDSAAMRVTNHPAANEFITKKYRGGFGV